jgi:hypothetical protein
LLPTGETLTAAVGRRGGADFSGEGGSPVIDPIVSEWVIANGRDTVVPLAVAGPHLALQSLIDDGLCEVSRRAPRPARLPDGAR